jgi:hypothetical protein
MTSRRSPDPVPSVTERERALVRIGVEAGTDGRHRPLSDEECDVLRYAARPSPSAGLVTVEQMRAALRDYPDADFSTHYVSAEEALALDDRRHRLAESRRTWIDAATAHLGPTWNGTPEKLREVLAMSPAVALHADGTVQRADVVYARGYAAGQREAWTRDSSAAEVRAEQAERDLAEAKRMIDQRDALLNFAQAGHTSASAINAALRDYPDADVSKLWVPANEALEYQQAWHRDVAKGRAAIEKLTVERDEALAQLAVLREAADAVRRCSYSASWTGDADMLAAVDDLRAALSASTEAASRYRARVRAEVLSEAADEYEAEHRGPLRQHAEVWLRALADEVEKEAGRG